VGKSAGRVAYSGWGRPGLRRWVAAVAAAGQAAAVSAASLTPTNGARIR